MKKIIYLLVLFALCSVASKAQEDVLILSNKILEQEYVKAVFFDSPFVIEESNVTSPNTKAIFVSDCSQKFLMPYEFNLYMNCKPHVLVGDNDTNIIRLYLYLAFFNGQKPTSKITIKPEENSLTGINYNYKATVEYKDKNYVVFVRYIDKQIERIDYFCDDVKIGFKIPIPMINGSTNRIL